jgi:sugar phosphate isomerase/epimerase
MRDETQSVIDEHNALECRYAAIGGLPVEYRKDGEGYRRFAKEASEVARKLKEAGIVFGYHNHSFELAKFEGKIALEVLFEESDPQVFTAEIDTYWIQHGGGDPAEWIRRMKGRIPVVHFKDMGISDGRQVMAEVGEGNLNWDAILEACKSSGVLWYIVEQDTCQRDPFESLAISFDNLKKMSGAGL